MFDELLKYKSNDHFFYQSTDSLEEVCNAPADKDGVYIVYELKGGRINMVYIGSSESGSQAIFKERLAGLSKSIINGPEPEKAPRTQTWPIKMMVENIDALDIYWWVTYKGNLKDSPAKLQRQLLSIYKSVNGGLPTWNKAVPGKR
ncbi:MAG: hypothetical protein ACXVJD_02810 [Mucilaginibacter sp.]